MIGICLDKTLQSKNISRYESYVLERICVALDCEISDVIEFIKE